MIHTLFQRLNDHDGSSSSTRTNSTTQENHERPLTVQFAVLALSDTHNKTKWTTEDNGSGYDARNTDAALKK
jgi:hypothetical protein